MEDKLKFISGDSLDELKKLGDNTVGIVITSPPYNINLKYNKYQDKKPREDYLEWLKNIFTEIKRTLKDDGHVFLNVGDTNIDPWISIDVVSSLRDLFHLQNKITWVKSISIGDETTGHFKPITSKRFLNNTNEHIFHLTKTCTENVERKAIGVPYKYKSNIERFSNDGDKRCKGNTWFIPYESRNKKEWHPCSFPINLVRDCILMTGKKTGLVLDPFSGSGTVVKTVQDLNENQNYSLSAIGIDIDDEYINYSKKRCGM
jgi:site-specific DNA-methyltransferase (adenine-specific)